MLRRSFRLESTGYYDSEGKPSISYRETMYRIFKRRKNCSWFNGRQTLSIIDCDNNRDNDRNGNSNRSSYSISTDNSSSNSNSNRISISISINNSNNNSKSESRSPTMFNLKTFGFLFFILPLCFGFAYLIHTLSSNILDSGPSCSPVSPTIMNTDLNAEYEDMARHYIELQGELLRLKKKINYLLPEADTLPNFALWSLGASVLFQRSSKTYQTQEARWTFFGIPLYGPVSPKIVIQGESHLVPGRCWAFAGGRGHLFIALSHQVTISHVTLGHISKNLSPTGSISSAPKEFSVYGMEALDDEGTRLGTFLYDQDGDSVQTFKLPDHKIGVFRYVKLQVESNWGNPDYSCLYSFRVHGKLAD